MKLECLSNVFSVSVLWFLEQLVFCLILGLSCSCMFMWFDCTALGCRTVTLHCSYYFGYLIVIGVFVFFLLLEMNWNGNNWGLGIDFFIGQVLYWLSGLTCTDENFIIKAGAQRSASSEGVALIAPDTSPSKNYFGTHFQV